MARDYYGDEAVNQKMQIGGGISTGAQYIPPSDRSKLLQKKEMFLAELKRVDAALEMLDTHPELEAITKVLQEGLR